MSVKPFRSYREVSHGRRVIQYHFHAGQIKALESKGRTVLVLAGTQGGKTVMGPVWLLNEIKKAGPGDYLAVAPTYPLMQKKMLPEFKRVWQEELRLGEYVGGAIKEFRVDPRQQEKLLRGTPFEGDTTPTRVLFGHAQDPDSSDL